MSNFMSNDNATAVLTPYANAIKSKKDIFSKKYQSSNILHNHWYRLFQIGSTTTWNVVNLRILVKAGYATLYEAFLCLRFTPDGIDPNDTYAEVISSRVTYKDIKIISVNSSTFGVVVKNLGNDQSVGFEILEYYSEQPTLFIIDDPFSDFGTSEPTAFGSHRYLTGSYNDLLDKPTLLALGETSSTAYRGDRGKTAYDHSQLTSGNPHNVSKSDVGLGNVGNFKAVSTAASQGLTDTEKSNARTNIDSAISKQLVDQDLNLVTTPGFYNAGGGNSCTNKPTGIDAFGLEVIKAAAGSYYLQRLTGSNSITTYRRKCNGGTWDAWIEEKITDTNNRRAFYGTCDTAAATVAKVVTLADTAGWELKAGTIVGVKFTYTNSASNCTLNVNGSGAKSVYYDANPYTGNSTYIFGGANKITYYMYDGTYWVWLGMDYLHPNSRATQTNTTDNADYRVLFSKTANDNNETSEVRKNTNFKYNPSTQNLMVPKINGVSTTYSSSVACVIGDTTCTITNSAITATSIIEEFCENTSGTKIAVTQVDVTTGQAVLHFAALTEATSFKLRITNI